jgi:transcriptional regulator with XRE-family HTH domain
MSDFTEAQRFRFYREFLGLSQAQLAATMGTTQTSVARWENDLAPISAMTMSHVKALVELKLREEIRKLFARLRPELYLCDFEGLFAIPSSTFTADRNGNIYLGIAEIMGHREHGLYVRIDDHQWYAIGRDGRAIKVDNDFLRQIRLAGRLQGGGMSLKDDPRVQRERIRRIAAKVYPKGEVVFDLSQPFTWIRFRVDDAEAGIMLSQPSGHYHVSEIADWADEKLENYLRALGPYFAEKVKPGH